MPTVEETKGPTMAETTTHTAKVPAGGGARRTRRQNAEKGFTASKELTDNLQQHLLFTRAELQRWKKLNMLLIDNNAEGLI